MQHDPNVSNYGKHLWIDHQDGRNTHYAHLNRIDVSVGQMVTAGQVLGLAGSTGNSSGPHLHIDLNRPGETYTDARGQAWPYNRHNPWWELDHLYKPAGRTILEGWVYDPYLTKGSDGQAVNYSTNLSLRSGPGIDHPKIGTVPYGTLHEILGDVENSYRPVLTWAVPVDPPTPSGIEMAPYFLPAVGDYGDICILKNNWGQGDERQQLQRTGNLSFVTKNQNWERRRIAADGIYLEMDTSPNEHEYYTITGSSWLPLKWNLGDEHQRSENVKVFKKADCSIVSQYSSSNKIRFDAQLTNWTSPGGIQVSDVIKLSWLINGVVEEEYWFGRGLGLVEWKNRAGKHSWVTERIPIGQQGNNVMEIIPCL